MGCAGSSIKTIQIQNEEKEQEPEMLPITPIILKVSKSFCKIKLAQKIFLGYLIKFYKREKEFFCLVTNYNSIKRENIEKKEIITILFDNDSKEKKVKLNSDERCIKDFEDYGIDALVVEILPHDEIEKDYFLEPLIEYMYNTNELINKDITIIMYTSGRLNYANGKIKEINKNEIIHFAKTVKGSSGCPIFLKDSLKVIGINEYGKKNNSENFGYLIGSLFNYFKNFPQLKIINDKYYNTEIELINKIPNGKGKEYYKNGNIKYEGDFINGKYEGKGKFIREDGNYYIGQWKNGV